MFKLFISLILGAFLTTLPTEVVIEEPLEAPYIIYVQDINEKAVVKFADQMNYAHATKQNVIPIVISSYGGSVYALLEMVDIIKAARLPVATIVIGKAMSAGAILLSCGDEGLRFAAPNSTIMLHEVSSMLGGNAQSVKMNAAEVERLNRKLFHLVAKNTGKSENYFLDIIHAKGHSEWYFNAEEAKKHNIINHIGLPTMETKIIIDHVLKIKEKEKAKEDKKKRRRGRK